MSSIKCSACGRRHEACDIDVLGHDNDVWFLEVKCPSCHTQSLVAAIIRETRALKPVGDPAEAEIIGLSHEAVTGDDIAAMHGFLAGFDGDFAHLFENG